MLLILPAVGPALAALITRRLERSDNADFRGLVFELRIQTHWRWYVAAAGLPAMILLIAHASSASSPLTTESFAPRHGAALIPVLAISILANPFEEIGWRGFALPRLMAKRGPWAASLLIGLLSALWHLPLLVSPDSPMSAYPVLPWAIGTVCVAFIATRLYIVTERSLPVLALYHIALNVLGAAIGIVSFQAYAWVSVGIVILMLFFSRRRSRIRH